MRRHLTVSALTLSLFSLAGCSEGSSCTILPNDDGTSTLSCSDGTRVILRNGTDGMNGSGCTVADGPGAGERTITCEDGTMVVVRDGMNGRDGDAGTPGRNALLTGPGLDLELRETGIDMDRHPYAVVRFTDRDGRPLDRDGLYTEGAVSASFTAAFLDTQTRVDGDVILPWQSYIVRSVTSADGLSMADQAGADMGGVWTEVDAEDGTYRYTFATTLPDTYDRTQPHRIGTYATRTFDGVRFVRNAVSTFRPDGMPLSASTLPDGRPISRDIGTTDACSTCHAPLNAHGGLMEDVQLCVTCHVPGTADPETDTSLDFESLVHRVHRGHELPSVEAGIPYRVVGFGGREHDFSENHFSQDIRHCDTCHTGPDAALPTLQPSRAACGSCHDDIWYEAGDPPAWMRLHPGGDRPDDTRCTVCHEASGGLSGIEDTHWVKDELPIAAIPEVVVDAVSLTGTRNIQIDFTVEVNGAPRNILTTPLTSLSAVVAGPTTDYLFNTSFTLTSASAGTLTARDAAMGQFRWVSTATVDAIAASATADVLRGVPGVTITPTGTWAIGMQATVRVNDTANASTTACTGTSTATCTAPAPAGASWQCVSSFCTPAYTYPSWNPVAYLALTDATPVPRREVVAIDRCNGCHDRLEIHGGGRNDPEYCVMCHNSTFDTADRMPIPSGTTARTMSVSMATFIHRIHTGADGASPATYWGPRPASPINAGGNPTDFSHVEFPADRRECQVCHVAALDLTTMLDLRPTRTRSLSDARTTVETFWRGATAAACLGCHDDDATAAHAAAMTTPEGESCAVCHEAGAEFGIDTVHSRPEYDLR